MNTWIVLCVGEYITSLIMYGMNVLRTLRYIIRFLESLRAKHGEYRHAYDNDPVLSHTNAKTRSHNGFLSFWQIFWIPSFFNNDINV